MCNINVTFIYLFCVSFIFNVKQYSTFNLDLRSAVIKPGKKGTYFGYSVALYRFNRERHLLIGAPLANGSMQVPSAGAIFKCNTERLSGCIQVHLDKRGEEIINGTKTEQKVGQWLGATLVSSKSGFVLTCAPRYIHFSENVKRREPVGLCYLSTLTLHTDSFEYSPCRLANQWGYHRRGSCQAGFSGAISKTGNTFFIAAPGSYFWQGQVYSYSRNNTSYSPIFTQERHAIDDDTYLGYSIVSGKFSNDINSMDIAIGMPKSEQQRGKVIILDRNLNLITQIKGELLGSYFGYSITTLDADGDGNTDLVVSAPMFSTDEMNKNLFDYEYGRVYIYYQMKDSYFGRVDKLNGYQPRSRFGTSIASLGDLNKDGFEDLAVGAPYDSISGTVYIYNGSPNGISSMPSQIIKPEYIPQGIGMKTFGWSLSGGVDLSNDDYPDLLVGAYESDAAVFFKSRAIIDTKVRFNFHPNNISLVNPQCSKVDGTQVSCITIDVCLAYNGPRAVPNRLKFLWFVTLDVFNNQTKPRMYVVNRENDNLNVNKGILALEKGNYGQCNKFKAYVTDYMTDKLSPIGIELQYHIQNNYNLPSNSRIHTPMLNRLTPNKILKTIYIMQNCGQDNVCVPDLKLKVTKNLDSYTLNGQENLIFNVNVSNEGEDAYDAVLNVDLPEDIDLIKIHQYSKDFKLNWQDFKVEFAGKNKLEIYLGNPFHSGERVNFDIELKGKEISYSSLNSDFTLIFNATTLNEEDINTLYDNVLVIGIPLRINITLEPFGQSFVNNKSSPYIYNITEYNEKVKLHKAENVIYPEHKSIIQHVYYLRNKGPSTIREMNLTILWPEKTIDGKWLFELIDQPQIKLINQLDRMDINFVNKKKYLKQLPIQVDCDRIQLGAILSLNNLDDSILEQEKIDPIDSDDFDNQDLINNQNFFNYYNNQDHTINNQEHSFKRIKRKYTLQEPAQAIFTMDCEFNQCRRIQCSIRDMAENTELIIKIISRPWNQTLRHISLSKFPVTSVLIAKISNSNLDFDPDLMLPITINVTTMVYLIGDHLDFILPLRSLITAVFVGFLLFGFLILILTKLDFFKREKLINQNIYKKSIQSSTNTSTSFIDQQNNQHCIHQILKKQFPNKSIRGRLLEKRKYLFSSVSNKNFDTEHCDFDNLSSNTSNYDLKSTCDDTIYSSQDLKNSKLKNKLDNHKLTNKIQNIDSLDKIDKTCKEFDNLSDTKISENNYSKDENSAKRKNFFKFYNKQENCEERFNRKLNEKTLIKNINKNDFIDIFKNEKFEQIIEFDESCKKNKQDYKDYKKKCEQSFKEDCNIVYEKDCEKNCKNFEKNSNEKLEESYDEESYDEEFDEEDDEESDEVCDEEYDEECAEESDEEYDEEYDEECDEEYDEECDEEYDEECYEEYDDGSDEELKEEESYSRKDDEEYSENYSLDKDNSKDDKYSEKFDEDYKEKNNADYSIKNFGKKYKSYLNKKEDFECFKNIEKKEIKNNLKCSNFFKNKFKNSNVEKLEEKKKFLKKQRTNKLKDEKNDEFDQNKTLKKYSTFRHSYNEKLYDKVHYSRNSQHFTFYKDTSEHQPNCPLYASRRSLVSYK